MVLGSSWWLREMHSMIGIISLVGILGYMFSISNDASLIPGLWGILWMSFMRCVVFRTLKAFGKGMRVVSNWLRYFASLYAGALIQLTMGLIGHWVLCTFGRPRMLGEVGFMWVSLVQILPDIREGHVLIVVFILLWNKLVGSF